MDPVTHLTTGALAARTLPSARGVKSFFLYAVICAAVPDVDNLTGFFGPELYLIHHRGVTHALLGAVVLAGLCSFVYSRLRPGLFSGGVLFGFAFAVLLGHIFLDLITSYGTQILAPFNRERYTLSCVFIIDPVFTGLLLLMLLVSRGSGRGAAARLGLLLVALYPLLCLTAKQNLEKTAERALRDAGVDFQEFTLSPDLFSPFAWKGIVDTGSQYVVIPVRPGVPISEETVSGGARYTKAPPLLLRRLSTHASMLATWAWFARYPVMARERPGADGQQRLRFGDLRFETAWRSLHQWRNGRNRPFSLTVTIGDGDRISAWEYSRPGRENVIHHIE